MKINNLMLTIVGTIAITIASGVNAQTFDDTGAYVGISANRISADFDGVNDVEFGDSETAVGIYAGYMFNDLLGIDIGFYDLGDYQAGETAATRIDLDGDAFTVSGLLNLSITDYIDVYGKLGVYYIETDSVSTVAGNVLPRNEDDTSGFGAIGIAYDFGYWNIFAEYLLADTDAHDLRIDVLSAGVKYEFGQ